MRDAAPEDDHEEDRDEENHPHEDPLMGWAASANPVARAVRDQHGPSAVKLARIERLAGMIPDRAAFERIVNQARPELRAGVRRQLIQFLRFPVEEPYEPPVTIETLGETDPR